MNKQVKKHPVTNTLSDVWNWFFQSLCAHFPEQEARLMARDIFEAYFGLTPDQRVTKHAERLPESGIQRLEKAIHSLITQTPLQYVSGSCRFLNAKIKVTPEVLIPRPETEELTQWIIQEISKQQDAARTGMKILDLGTGSGCMAIALAMECPDAHVFACDISEQSLEVARFNALYNNVKIVFIQCDLEDSMALPGQFSELDVLLSNPPYVRESEKALMHANVLDHEPAGALFVPDQDPLLYYRAIARHGQKILRPGGRLFLEINEAFGQDCCQLLMEHGYQDIVLKKDYRGKDRFIGACLGKACRVLPLLSLH